MKTATFFLWFLMCSMSFITKAQNGFNCFVNTGSIPTFKSMATDNAGNIWLTYNGGSSICKFSNGTFTDITTSTLSNVANYTSIVAYANGNIWLGSNKGLVKYDGNTWQLFNQSNSNIPSDTINCLAFDGSNILGGTPHGVFQLNNSTFTIYNVANSNIISDKITAIACNGNVKYIGTDQGLSVLANGICTSYNTMVQGVLVVNITSFYVDQSSGDVWLTINNTGIANAPSGNVFILRNNQLLAVNDLVEISQNIPASIRSVGKGPNGSIMFMNNNKTFEIYGDSLHNNFKPFTTVNNAASPAPWNLSISAAKICFANNITYILPVSNKKLITYTGGSSMCPDNSTTNNNYRSLDINNCVAPVMTKGDMFWDIESGQPKYEVPKGSGKSPIFASALWLGGIDASGNIHISAQTYRQAGSDYWPGPLDTVTGSTDSNTVYQYDKIWKINRYDIESFKYHFNNGTVQNGSFIPAIDILNWPAHGTGNQSRNLAPFIDVNGNGIYDPLVGGDYPKIKGDQMLFWIFNDNLGTHTETGGTPLKVEVHASAYAFVCNNIADSLQALNNTTFFQYEIYNRSSVTYDSCYVGNWVDYDLGNSLDDLPGCLPKENVGFAYNADANDETASGYGSPAFISQKILDGPLASLNDGIDNDNDAIIDEAGEKLLLTNFITSTNSTGNQGNATNINEYFNYLHGIWKDGTLLTYGGDGYGGTTPTNFIFDGLFSNSSNPWIDTISNEFRCNSSSGPFIFAPQQKIKYEYAFIFNWDRMAPDYNGIYSKNSILNDYKQIQNWYNQNSFPSCLDLSSVDVKNISHTNTFGLFPNPANDELHLNFKTFEPNMRINVYDISGKLIKQFLSDEIESSQNELKINIKHLPAGIYNIQYQSNLNSYSQKFIKE